MHTNVCKNSGFINILFPECVCTLLTNLQMPQTMHTHNYNEGKAISENLNTHPLTECTVYVSDKTSPLNDL